MQVSFYASAIDIPETVWQDTRHNINSYPFLSHEFLTALEHADNTSAAPAACCAKTGWQPHHAVVYQGQQALALMPLYIKFHSYGEYIFDWAWADAYRRHSQNYYPKLFCGIPYTPATGPRIRLANTNSDYNTIFKCLVDALKNEVQRLGASSMHLLFSDKETSNTFDALGFKRRASFQYHWFNQNEQGAHFTGFEQFLSQLKSRKRKAISKERQAVLSANISIERLSGKNISPSLWDQFYIFYQNTYAKRSGHGGYLPKHFFHHIGNTLGEKIMLVTAKRNDKIIAAALNFYSDDTLYGRYWGCSLDYEFLHFELCYYQGIEFCIEQGLRCFDAGAQGEHKIQRGFRPIETHSNHWLANPAFNAAIESYIEEEQALVRQQIQSAKAHSPFSIK